MKRIDERRTTQRLVAEQLGLTVRQVERLYRAYKGSGAQGLVSRKRGAPSNHQLSPELRALGLSLVRERYADFGPTLAHEKLVELHGLGIGLLLGSVEEIRTAMGQYSAVLSACSAKDGSADRARAQHGYARATEALEALALA